MKLKLHSPRRCASLPAWLSTLARPIPSSREYLDLDSHVYTPDKMSAIESDWMIAWCHCYGMLQHARDQPKSLVKVWVCFVETTVEDTNYSMNKNIEITCKNSAQIRLLPRGRARHDSSILFDSNTLQGNLVSALLVSVSHCQTLHRVLIAFAIRPQFCIARRR